MFRVHCRGPPGHHELNREEKGKRNGCHLPLPFPLTVASHHTPNHAVPKSNPHHKTKPIRRARLRFGMARPTPIIGNDIMPELLIVRIACESEYDIVVARLNKGFRIATKSPIISASGSSRKSGFASIGPCLFSNPTTLGVDSPSGTNDRNPTTDAIREQAFSRHTDGIRGSCTRCRSCLLEGQSTDSHPLAGWAGWRFMREVHELHSRSRRRTDKMVSSPNSNQRVSWEKQRTLMDEVYVLVAQESI